MSTPLRAFLRSGAVGGLLLILASLAALVWSNSAAAPVYFRLLDARVSGLPLHGFINDGLMAFFFLLAGLEIRREMTRGRLASRRGMAAPGVAALGGMLVPAAIYLATAHGDAVAVRGWAVPVATDIAFSLAVLRILGRRVPVSVRVFLTALAILDDLGAILVIALFYGHGLAWPFLAGAAVVCAGLLGLRRAGVVRVLPYLGGGLALWVMVFDSGVHATLAGVALAFLVPARTAARLEHGLAGIVAYAILPIFGLANAGLAFHGMKASVLLQPAPLGILLALLFGKQIGVFGAAMLGRWAGLVRLPAGMGVGALYGAALLCGIGFTMSLFIGDLAFRALPVYAGVKLAVFCASLASAAAGLAVLAAVARPGA